MAEGNAFVKEVTASVPTSSFGQSILLESQAPFHDIVVTSSALESLAAGDTVVSLSGRPVPRRLTAAQLVEGVRKRRRAAAAEAPERLTVTALRREQGAFSVVRADGRGSARRVLVGAGRGSCGGRDATGLPVVVAVDGGGTQRAGAASLARGDVIVAVDGAPAKPSGRGGLDGAESLVAVRSLDFLEVEELVSTALVDERDAAQFRCKVSVLGVEVDSPACVAATSATPCSAMCLTK